MWVNIFLLIAAILLNFLKAGRLVQKEKNIYHPSIPQLKEAQQK